MNKDAVLATIIGFSIGLVVTTILLFGPAIVNTVQGIKLPALSKIEPTASPVASSDTPSTLGASQQTSLTIDAPLTESIANTSEVLVSGAAPAFSTITISGNTDDFVTNANTEGKFAGSISVAEGKNEILVSSMKDGIIQSQSIVVYYTPENF